jgi:hypothetical protein
MIKKFKSFEGKTYDKLEFEILNTIDAFIELEEFKNFRVQIGMLIGEDASYRYLCTPYDIKLQKIGDFQKLLSDMNTYNSNSIFIKFIFEFEDSESFDKNSINSPDFFRIMQILQHGMSRSRKSRYSIGFHKMPSSSLRNIINFYLFI